VVIKESIKKDEYLTETIFENFTDWKHDEVENNIEETFKYIETYNKSIHSELNYLDEKKN
jgi:hypothetical protein